ncbi:MAG: carboxypeptidase regulatory-like domain-containing protein [Elusimicrobia bacterium]|nr:carboxypeptidase regulatory-like domain-containing protein [Elusimicrobiota bacterium]
MKKTKKMIWFILISMIAYQSARALEIRSVTVTDQLGGLRSNYSNTEKVNFNVTVFNNTVLDRINFRFEIYDAAGNSRFTHTGNSIPGTIGEGASFLRYIPITNFFSTSGNYRLVVFANTIMKETTFSVYSPNLTLTYPSNYARDLTDNPLIFRWVASGAAKYRIYVDDDAAFFNCLFTDETNMTQYTYPSDPADVRKKLSAGTIYYWKVEGLDASNNIVAKTATPSNFTIKASAVVSTSKDLAILDIKAEQYLPKVIVSVKNQGGKTESSIPVSLYLSGSLVGTQNIDSIASGEIKNISFLTNVYGTNIAMASITFDDDYSKNNILTKQISVYTPVVGSTVTVVVEKAKILGTVMTADGNKLPDAVVSYDGAGKGSVKTNSGGEYKIEDLEIGEYKLKASASGYVDAEAIVKVDKSKAYTNVDFKLNIIGSKAAAAEAEKIDYSNDEKKCWSKLKEYIANDKIFQLFEDYEIDSIETKEDINKIMSELESGKSKISGVEIVVE